MLWFFQLTNVFWVDVTLRQISRQAFFDIGKHWNLFRPVIRTPLGELMTLPDPLVGWEGNPLPIPHIWTRRLRRLGSAPSALRTSFPTQPSPQTVRASLWSSWSPASVICQTSSTVSSTSSTRHLWDPCFFCSRTNSLEFTARLYEGSSCRLRTI